MNDWNYYLTAEEGFDNTTFTNYGGWTIVTNKKLKLITSSFVIKRDGTWEMNLETESTWTEAGGGWPDSTVKVQNIIYEQAGNWSFVAESENYENKERVLFDFTKNNKTITTTNYGYQFGSTLSASTYIDYDNNTYEIGQSGAVYDIDQLKSREIIFKKSGAGVHNIIEYSPFGSDPSDHEFTDDFTMILKKAK
ncbi:MAG: hypothetical protein MK078_03770 [Crocinitomicaceae bacterium]|nr:hypothetical protein [Crocinitomicaceae bacterium]